MFQFASTHGLILLRNIFGETLLWLQGVCYICCYNISEIISRPAICMTRIENEKTHVHSKINHLNVNNFTEGNVKEEKLN